MKFLSRILLVLCFLPSASGQIKGQDCKRLLDSLGKLVSEGRYLELESVLPDADSICRIEVNEKDSLYASLLDAWGVYYVTKGDNQTAISYFEKAIRINLQARGFLNDQTGATYNNISQAYAGTGDWEKALAAIDTALLIGEKTPGSSSLIYGERRMNRGVIYIYTSRFADAAPDLEFAIKNAEENKVPKFSFTRFTRLSALAVLYTYRGDFQKALPPSIEIVEIADSLFGIPNPNTLLARNNLSQVYYNMGDLPNAESLARPLLPLAEEVMRGHPLVSNFRSNLGMICLKKGQYHEALRLFQQTLAEENQMTGVNPLQHALLLQNLANVYMATGSFDRAVPLLTEAREIVENNLGKENREYAAILNSLAVCHNTLGNNKLASELANEAFGLVKKYGENFPNYETVLSNTILPLEESAQALPRLLEIAEIAKKKYGGHSLEYGIQLSNYASYLGNLNRAGEALPILEDAEEILRKSAGTDHKDYLDVLRSLAAVHEKLGQYQKARILWKRCLALAEKSTGRINAFYASVVGANADTEEFYGKRRQAFAFYFMADTICRRLAERNFAVLSDNGRERFLQQQVRPQLDAWRSFAWRHAGAFDEIPALLYDDMLWEKGYLLHSARAVLISMRSEPALAGAMQNWLGDRERLLKLYENASKTAADRAEIANLTRTSELSEALLTQRSPTFRAARQFVGWQDVRSRLAPDEAAMEFFRFRYSKPEERIIDSAYYYAAVVLRPGIQAPVFIPLFEEKQLDSILNCGFTDGEEVFNAIYGNDRLYRLLWAPLQPHLDGVRRVWYAPDGKLHQVAFAALPLSDSLRLAQTIDLQQVGSTRELVVSPEPLQAAGLRDALLLGCVAYPTDSIKMKQRDPACDRTLCDPYASSTMGGSDRLNNLPCTGGEVEELGGMLAKAGVRATVKLGYGTLEDDLKNDTRDSVTSPGLLHFAGHGYTGALPDSLFGRFPANNPMFSSMLLLAGAQDAWAKGRSVPGFDDGLLTARELGDLNLTDTRLVVLSGCQTALGSAQGSEGVYGLQRGVKLAGAKAVLATLWKIPDNAESRWFLRKFYVRWLEGASAREALRDARREAIGQGLNPVAWAAWVMI